MKKRRVRRFIARNRRSRPVRALADWCWTGFKAYENFNYDQRTNGEEAVLRRLAGEPLRCIFDVGANVGKWSLLAHEVFPQAAIHSFEVMPSTSEELIRRTKHVPEITVNSFGLSDRSGPVSINHFADNDTWTTITDYPHDLPRTEVEGQVLTGAEYLERNGIEHIDFLKIDVEGVEHLVLHGMEAAIREQRVEAVQFEYGRVSVLTKFLLRDFHLFFEERGYAVGKIFPNYVEFREYDVDHENFIGPNFLAVRRERKDWIEALG